MAITPVKLGLIADPPALVLIYKIRSGAGDKSGRRKRKIPLRNFTDTTNVSKYIDAVVRARHTAYLEEVPNAVIQKLLRITQLVQKGCSIGESVAKVDEELGLGQTVKEQGERHDHELNAPEDKQDWTGANDTVAGAEKSASSPDELAEPTEGFDKVQINEQSSVQKYLVNRVLDPMSSDADEDDLDVKSVSFSISLKKKYNQDTKVSSKQDKDDTDDDNSASRNFVEHKLQPQPPGQDETTRRRGHAVEEESEKSEKSNKNDSGSESDGDSDSDSKAKFTDNLFSIFQPPKSRVAQLKNLKSSSGSVNASEQLKDSKPKINIRHFMLSSVRSNPNSNLKPNPCDLPQEKSEGHLELKQDGGEVKLAAEENEAQSPFWSSFKTNTPDDYVAQLPKSVKFNLSARIMNSQSIESNNDDKDDDDDSGSDQVEELKPVQDINSEHLEGEADANAEEKQAVSDDGESANVVQSLDNQLEELFFTRPNLPRNQTASAKDLEHVFDTSASKKDDNDDDSDGFW